MAELTLQRLDNDGLSVTNVAAEATDTFRNDDGDIILKLVNADVSDIDVTVVAQGKCNMGFLHDAVFTVPASGELLTPVFEKARFNDDNQMVTVDYGGSEANITVAAIKL